MVRIPKDVVVVMAMEVQSFLSVLRTPGTNRPRRIHVHLNYYVLYILLIASRQLVLDYCVFSLRSDRELTLRRLLGIQREFSL